MNRHSTLRWLLFATLTALLSSCGGVPTVGGGVPTEPTEPIWKVIPTKISFRDAGNGWKDYSFEFVIENQGASAFSPAYFMSGASVETKEGYTYPLNPPSIGGDDWIPAGFRITGYGDRPFVATFRAAATATPTRVHIDQNFVDLTPNTNLSFPTSRPKSDFRNLGETLSLPIEQLAFTLGSARKNTEWVTNAAGGTDRTIVVDVKVQNLNQGQESQGSGLIERCFIVDGIGRIRNQMMGVVPSGYRLGPGQTQEGIMPFALYLPGFGDKKPGDAKFDAAFTNAKLICPTGWPNSNEQPKDAYIYNLN